MLILGTDRDGNLGVGRPGISALLQAPSGNCCESWGQGRAGLSPSESSAPRMGTNPLSEMRDGEMQMLGLTIAPSQAGERH